MPNIPGFTLNVPSVVVIEEVVSGGVALPAATRIASIIGEGAVSEVIVGSAQGGGKDGLDGYYSTSGTPDGRHFVLQNFPIISNRTQLFRNGILLVGLEEQIDQSSFSNRYDYRIDIALGHIELQQAYLVNQGGLFYSAASTNVGAGSINSLTLVDVNAPSETWSIKCISVKRDTMNNPIADTAVFSSFGSVSGLQLDANGNPIVWIADGYVVSNNILRFSVAETTTFVEGDTFVIKVSSGVLNKNDTLTATYIPVANINDPQFFQNMTDIVHKHGLPSTDNNLSLGCQLAFANQTPGVMCLQAAPPMPRRTSYDLTSNMLSTSTNDADYIFPLPIGVAPDVNSQIHVFIKNPATNIEKQILPNKFPFYTLGTIGQPTVHNFIFDSTLPPAGNSFSYSVIAQNESLNFGFDGYIARTDAYNHALFSSGTVYDNSYIGTTLQIIDANNVANKGTFTVSGVSNGDLIFSTPVFSDFTNGSSIAFQIINPSTGLPVPGGSATDGYLTAIGGTGTGTFGDANTSVDFSTISAITSKRLQINGTTVNNGLYDILSVNLSQNTIVIEKAFVIESNVRYEITDSSNQSSYVVLNQNVVPTNYGVRITIVDARDATFFDAGWENALFALEAQTVDIVVPLPKSTISVIFENTVNHCITMSNQNNRLERVAFIGAINGLTPDNLTGAKPAAVEDIGILEGIQGATVADVLDGNTEDLANYSVSNAYGTTFRAVYFFPDQIVVNVGGQNILIDGFYQAAAAAGYLSASSNVAIPLTNKVLSGYTILRNRQFSTLIISQLIAAGVTVVQPVSGGGRVVYGITTSQSGFPEDQEISIIFIRDRIAKDLRNGFQDFIGTAQDPFIVEAMSARLISIANGFVARGLITQFKSPQVIQDSVDPRQIDISLLVAPTYPINFVRITVSIGPL